MTENQRKKIIESQLRTPECIQCFAEIREQGNSVFGAFELNSKELMEDQKKEFTDHIKAQEEKYDKFLIRAEKRDYWRSSATLLLLTLFASVIAYSFNQQENINENIIMLKNEKADKTEIVNKYEFEVITQQGDEYNKNMFVVKTQITADTFSYPMNKKRLFNSASRGVITLKPIKENEILKDVTN